MDAVREKLFSLQDESVQRFAAKLLPTIDPERIIGVRIPLLRATARTIYKSDKVLCYSFLEELPHAYVEEDLLHMMLIGLEPNAVRQIELLDRFLPFADNWCVTDALSAKTMWREPALCRDAIRRWLVADTVYTRRTALVALMESFRYNCFDPCFLDWAAKAAPEDSSEVTDVYYLRMAVAWFFAEALTQQYELTLPYIEEGKLPNKTRLLAIRKACESRKVPADRKEALRLLRNR